MSEFQPQSATQAPEPLIVPRRPKKRGPNIGMIIIAVVAILGVGGAWAVLKFGAHVAPAGALTQGVASLSHADQCLRDGNVICAQADYIAYIKKYPNDLMANARLAIVLTQDGRHRESLRYYKQSFALGGDTYDLYANYARSLEATGDLDGSIKANQKALEIVPTLVDVRGTLADQLVRKGRAAEAVSLLEAFDQRLADQGEPAYFPAKIDAIKRGMGGAAAREVAARIQAEAAARTAESAPPEAGVTLVRLQRGPGVHSVPVKLNGVVEADFVVDSGASHVVISEDVLRQLIESKTLTRADYMGAGYAELADGSRVRSEAYNIRSLKVGERTLHNVTAMVTRGRRGQLLLGQTFLRRFKSWSVDNRKGVLELRE